MSWPWILLILLGGGSFREILRSRARSLRIWRDAAAECGLRVVKSTSVWAWRLKLKAEVGPIEVRIEGARGGNVGSHIVVVVPGLPGISSVRIRREVGEPGASEVEIGDKAFDTTFSIEGPMRLVCVLLDAEARRLLLRLNAKSQVEIAGGELRAETFDTHVPSVLSLLVELGRRFAQKMDVVQCLAENARRDPQAGVRLSNLLLLVRECAWGPSTEQVLRAACSDRSPQVRLRAAIELGPKGRDILRKLAESTKNDDCGAQAVRAIGHELPFDCTTAILDRALYGRRIQTACACLEVLGLSGTSEAVDVLAEVMAQEEGRAGRLSTTAAQALGTTGSAAAEPPLIVALRSDMPDLRVAAARALGRVGSATAVLPLKEAAQRFPRNPDLASTTRQAIVEIQSRLTGATPGQLSLAGAETGQLSLAQDEAGQLSLAADQGGQLSLNEKGREPAPEQER